MKLKELTWDEGKYNCHTARIGTARVATVVWDAMRSRGSEVPPYVRTVEAWGLKATKRFENLADAKASVESGLKYLINLVVET